MLTTSGWRLRFGRNTFGMQPQGASLQQFIEKLGILSAVARAANHLVYAAKEIEGIRPEAKWYEFAPATVAGRASDVQDKALAHDVTEWSGFGRGQVRGTFIDDVFEICSVISLAERVAQMHDRNPVAEPQFIQALSAWKLIAGGSLNGNEVEHAQDFLGKPPFV